MPSLPGKHPRGGTKEAVSCRHTQQNTYAAVRKRVISDLPLYKDLYLIGLAPSFSFFHVYYQ
ncbi:hypothetical protein JOC95_001099 [Bacillus tianshenii]|uniref:Uncharacterized protein n=1 Tax=Sutcliffiella tianshenii TaxID=1463404 RepID=A0ABS2NYC9_9BACI|nr:hypothetical protein [Bacillus tianshenii]MBM7619250.1 hypothetical protein [Bacillus tianshenii]